MSSTKDHETARMRKSHLKKSNAASEYGALTIGRGVGTCLRVEGKTKSGEQRPKILRENFYFEAILVNFQQKWGEEALPPPLFSIPLTRNWYC